MCASTEPLDRMNFPVPNDSRLIRLERSNELSQEAAAWTWQRGGGGGDGEAGGDGDAARGGGWRGGG